MKSNKVTIPRTLMSNTLFVKLKASDIQPRVSGISKASNFSVFKLNDIFDPLDTNGATKA